MLAQHQKQQELSRTSTSQQLHDEPICFLQHDQYSRLRARPESGPVTGPQSGGHGQRHLARRWFARFAAFAALLRVSTIANTTATMHVLRSRHFSSDLPL